MIPVRIREWLLRSLLAAAAIAPAAASAQEADLILHNGKIVTVDRAFTISQALAVKGDRLIRVGTSQEVMATRGPRTTVIDLAGKMVLPGLIDSHAHPSDASLTEFDHPVPDMETISDVLNYIRTRAAAVGPMKWVIVRQVFITRLKEQRYPTRSELDQAAPENPVLFATGPDASLNSLALKLCGIDRNFQVEGAGQGRARPANRRTDRHPSQLRALYQGRVSGQASDTSRSRSPADSRFSPTTIRSGSRRSSIAMPTRRQSSATSGCTLQARCRSEWPFRTTSRPLAISTRSAPKSATWQAIRFAAAARGSKSSESRLISTAACSPAVLTCASPGA